MLREFLPLLCLGLGLGFEDEKKNETLPKPSLGALSSLVVGRRDNVTLRCQSHFQNVTFMLGKLEDSRYRQEQRSTGHKAEFLLTHLEPKDAGMYFCAYKTMVSQEWSGESEYLQLKVKGSSHEESTKSLQIPYFNVFLSLRTSHSEFPKQEATDLSNLERISVSTERPPGSEPC
ncbi:V-set and transmembrane domain-containing protein 1 isoform X3 [Halichoerus grypus]